MIQPKHILPVFLCALTGMFVQCQSSNNIQKIEYTSMTRGYQKQVVFSHDSVVTTISGRDNQISRRPLATTEWKTLTESLKGVTLDSIATLESPTQKRQYDGARHSTLTVFTPDGKAVAHSFDNEDAHATLMPLMNAVRAIEEKGAK